MTTLAGPASIRRILVIKLRAIGDVLLSTVVLENLRSAFPAAELHFLTEPPAAGLLSSNPLIDRLLVFDRRTMTGAALIRLVRRQRYDLVFDLFGNPRTALVTKLSGARNRVGYRFRGRSYAYNYLVEPRGDRVHNTQFNLDALERVAIPVAKRTPVLPIPTEAREAMAAFVARAVPPGGPLVAINAGGGWYTKRWGVDRFARLAERLARDDNARILVLWGPGEREDAERLVSLMAEPGMLAPPTSLLELAALLEHCGLLVTNDSGPMHIGAAVGTRVLALFGPTNPLLQGPFGGDHRVLRLEELECLGCNLTSCPIGHPCMEKLPVDRVYQEARSVLAELMP